MRRSELGSALAACGLLATTSLGLAQTPEKPPEPAPAASPAPPASPVPVASPPPKPAPPARPPASPPPAAAAGPSPYSALIQKGDSAYIARDFDAAIGAYRAEVQKNPSSAAAHFRLGQAELAKGDSAEAELSWQAALRFAAKDEALKSKVLFVLADLKERDKAYDEATARWKTYQEHAQTQPETKGTYPATATERLKRIEEWKKISEDASAVKARIEKRLKEGDEALRKSSK